MFDPDILLKAIPSIWSDRFADANVLKTVYGYVGEYLSEAYQAPIEKLSSATLNSTPLYKYKTWHHLPLYEIHRLHLPATTDAGTSLVVYGLREEDFILLNCARIYYTPDSTSEYLQVNRDYSFLDRDSSEIRGLESATGSSAFFSRFNRFIVFYSIDPLFDSGYAEKEKETANYPLTFRVNSHLISDPIDTQKIGSTVTLQTANLTTSASILDIQVLDEDTLVYFDPSCFTNTLDDGLVTITDLTDQPIAAQVYATFNLEMQDINLWAYRCTLDEFSLFKRWGYLLGPDQYTSVPIRSSETYRLLLETILECRLFGLSTTRLSKVASILGGSEALAFSSLNDTLDKLDLQLNTLTSDLTRYTVIPEALLNFRVVENCQRIKVPEATIPTSQCVFLKLSDRTLFSLVYSKMLASTTTRVTFSDSTGAIWGEAICACDDQRIVIRVTTAVPQENSTLRAYYSGLEHILIRPSNYEVMAFAQDDNLSQDTIINPVAKVVDYFTGLTDYIGRGLYIPSDIWEVESSFRREVVYERTPFIVGSMPRHRIGDYEFIIPTADPNAGYFDSPSELNPEGYSWATSYKLLKHFLQTKVGLITPLPFPLRGSFGRVVTLVENVRDISKAFLTLESVDVVDYIPIPQDTLEVYVDSAVQDTTQAVSYAGIGSLGATLLLAGDLDIVESDIVDALGLLPPPSEGGSDIVQYTIIPIALIGYYSGYALVDAGHSPEQLLNLIELGYTIDLRVNSVYKPVSLDLASNYVGSSSQLMVVGASYPEYTRYYDFSDNTLSEWLQISTQPGRAPNELVEDPIVVSSNLADPIELIPVTQDLEDNVPLPSDQLPTPSEE